MSSPTPDIPDQQTRTSAQAPLPVAVGATAMQLQAQYSGGQGERARAAARGVLAELRRQAGRQPESDPLSLERVLMTLSPTLSDEEIGRGDAPSPSERAAFHALSLFALHMQSATAPMHRRGVSFASACGQLYAVSESQSMKPRFDALLLARNSRSQLTHARSLITLLRSRGIGFDYGAFANDLRLLANPARRSGVLLRWGRDFAMGPYRTEKNSADSHSAQK